MPQLSGRQEAAPGLPELWVRAAGPAGQDRRRRV